MVIVTHRNFHQDEAAGIALLALEGDKVFPGISNAPIKLVSSPEEASQFPDAFRVGVGGGEFDEHNRKDEQSRFCAADLVAQRLGIADEPAIAGLLDHVRHADKTSEVHEMELSSLMKGWHLLHPSNKVLQRSFVILYDLIRHARAGMEPGNPALLNSLADELQRRHGYDMYRGSKRVIDYLRESAKRPNRKITSLANIALVQDRLYGHQSPHVRRWVMEILEDAVELNHRFQKMYRAYRPKFHRVWVGGLNRPLRMALIRSDDPFIVKVARAKGAEIVVLQSTRGNIQIFTSRAPALDMSSVAMFIRMAECVAQVRPIPRAADRQHWASAENTPEVPEWYYLQAGQMLLNGSNQSSQGVKPTKIPRKLVVELVRRHVRLLTS